MIKQAIILAAGSSSRFYPFNEKHKSEVVLLGKPIISWTLESLKKQNFSDVVVVVGAENTSLEAIVKKHSNDFDKLTVVLQEKSLGMADAILSAKDHLTEQFFVLNTNHFFIDNLIEKILAKKSDVVLTCQPTKAPELYGVVSLENGLATSLVEKPTTPTNNSHRVVGVYLLSKKFLEMMEGMPSEEYLLESALDAYMKNNPVEACVIDQDLPTLKYPWHLLTLKNYLLDQMEPTISDKAQVANTAIIRGNVQIEPGALVADYAIIDGPAYIGKEAVVGQHSVIRKGSILEEKSEVQRYGDVANSILMKNASIHSGFIGDSVIGENVSIGAGFITANRRLDREEISAYIKDKKVKTGLTNLGVIVGHDAKIGIKVGTMPNVIVGAKAIIQPGTIIKKNI